MIPIPVDAQAMMDAERGATPTAKPTREELPRDDDAQAHRA
jgi:hypothetical protein